MNASQEGDDGGAIAGQGQCDEGVQIGINQPHQHGQTHKGHEASIGQSFDLLASVINRRFHGLTELRVTSI